MGEGVLKDGIVAGTARGRPIRRQFRRPASAARSPRGARRGRPLLFLLRRAVPDGLPDLDRHPDVHPRNPDRQPARRGRDDLRAEHPRRHVRPRLPHRAALRRGLRARGGRGQAGQDRPAAALRHRYRDGRRTRSSSPAPPASGKRVAVVGAGPAGLAAAHRLALHGHDVVIFDARDKAGGLNEYGIASYKTPGGFAQAEVDYVTAIGGITIETGKALGRDFVARRPRRRTMTRCSSASGSAASTRCAPRARTPTASTTPSTSSRMLRQASDLASLPIGRRVVVIGGGMTAVDAAVQAKLLGAEEVTMVYRRGKEQMNASRIRAGSGGRQGRHHPALAGAEARAHRGRQGHRHRARATWRSTRPAALTRDRRDDEHRLRPGVQGHRPDARDRWRGRGARRRQDRGRCRRAARRWPRSGPAATAPPAATTSPSPPWPKAATPPRAFIGS